MDWIKDFMKPEFIWAMVGLILLLLEFALPGLIIFFFGVGAWIVAATCFFVDISVDAQLVIFIVSSVVLLLALRKWLKSVFDPRWSGGGGPVGPRAMSGRSCGSKGGWS